MWIVYDDAKIEDNLNRLQAALDESGGDQVEIACAGLDVVATLLRKNADYGCAVFNEAVLAPEQSSDTLIRVRMSDKIARLNNLFKSGNGEVSESIEDTMLDLAGYAILWVTLRRKQNGSK